MLNRYHEQIEFDFDQRGWDLLDFWRGRITLRKLWVRITNLPSDSAFLRAVDPSLLWGTTEHAIADMHDDLVRLLSGDQTYRRKRPGDAEREQAAAKSRAEQWEHRRARREAARRAAAQARPA